MAKTIPAAPTTSPAEIPLETEKDVTVAATVPVEAAVPVIGAIAASNALIKGSSFWTTKKICLGVMIGVILFLVYKYKNKILAFFTKKSLPVEAVPSEEVQEGPRKRVKFNTEEELLEPTPVHEAEPEQQEEESPVEEGEDYEYLDESQMNAIAEEANKLCGDAGLLPDLEAIAQSIQNQSSEMFVPMFVSMDPPGMEQSSDQTSKITELIEEQAEEELPLPASSQDQPPSPFPHAQEKFGKRSRKRQAGQ